MVPKSAESSKPGWIPALFTPRGSQRRPDPASADVYSLLNKFRMSEPCGSTLEIKFHRQRGGVATPGVTPIQSGNTSSPGANLLPPSDAECGESLGGWGGHTL